MTKSLTTDEEAFVERLNGAIERIGGAAKVAEREPVALKTVYNWKAGANASAAVALFRIAKACGTSVDALFQAYGNAESGVKFPDRTSTLSDIVDVPILDVTAGAGGGVENGEPSAVGHLPFSRQMLRRLGIKPPKVRGLRASGDSMWPTIADGQLVLINTEIVELKDGHIYAVHAPDGLRLKRIQRQMDGSVLLISDNKELYEPERVPPYEAEAIRAVGHAFWTERLI